jgi:hypothetical protein
MLPKLIFYIEDKMFASGSSDGTLILWLSENLTRCIELKPFDELNQNEALKRLNLTSVNCFKCLYDVSLKLKLLKFA